MTLIEFARLLQSHRRLVIGLPLVALAIVAAALALVPDTYTASTTLYVLTRSQDNQASTSSDLTASQMLTNDVTSILTSDRVRTDVASALGITSGYEASVDSSSTTRVVKVSVSGSSPELAAQAANAYAQDAAKVAQELMGTDAVSTLDSAAVPTTPSGPNRPAYLAVALLGGLVAAVVVVLAGTALDTRLHGADDVENELGLSVMAAFGQVR